MPADVRTKCPAVRGDDLNPVAGATKSLPVNWSDSLRCPYEPALFTFDLAADGWGKNG